MGHKVKQSLVNSRVDFFYYAFRNVLLVSVPLLIFSIFVFTIPHSSAEISSGADNIQLVLSTSCTVNAVVTIAHETSLHGGQKDDNVGNTKLSAFCNDNNGYSIYAVGSSGDVDGNTDLINTVNESYNIHTGVYDDSAQTNPSSWAMKLTAGTGTGIDPITGESVPTTPPTIINGFDNYSTIPNVYTQVAKRTSGTSMTADTSISGSYLNTTYQIYANSAQPAGTYNGKVKYAIVHPNSNNNTIPDLDTAFAVAGKMKVYEEGGNSYYAMQDMDSQICNMVANDGEITSTQLVDLRDNKLYWVTKLKDEHCWMTQNLDLEISHLTTLTSETTDLNDNSLLGAYSLHYAYDPNTGVISWTPERTTSTGTWQQDYYKAYSIDPGVWYWDGNDNTPSCNYLNSACEHFSRTMTPANKYFSVGNYYNWSAAIASDDSSSLTASTYGNVNNNPQNSICPKGWRLPTVSDQQHYSIGSTNEFAMLNSLYNSNKTNTDAGWIANPLRFVRSGSFDRSLDGSGKNAYYWSSTIYSNHLNYHLYFLSNRVNSIAYRYQDAYDDYTRYMGFSIRCLSR